MTKRFAKAAVLGVALLTLAAPSARASLYSFAVSGTTSSNSSGDSTIPIGTPFSFEVVYDTAAPDLDFELTGASDPTFGRFTNSSVIPALTFFHYQAGSYEVTIDDPADFGTSVIDITFLTTAHAIDINVFAPGRFPPLGGGPVSFHADFNAFSTVPIFTSDGLPTNTALGVDSFDQSTVSLLPPSGEISSSSFTSLTLSPVPEPSTAALAILGLLGLFGMSLTPRRRVICRIGAAAALALALAGPARAAEPKKAPPPAPTAEERQKMAEVHQKMADCLRSDRPIAECRSEMATACHDLLGGDACPMMGNGAGGMGSGMMGGGKGHSQKKSDSPSPTTPAPPEAPEK